MYIFIDVFKDVIVVVVFLKVWKDEENSDIGFLMGKVKVVLVYGYIILRLELCVVVFGLEIVEIIRE